MSAKSVMSMNAPQGSVSPTIGLSSRSNWGAALSLTASADNASPTVILAANLGNVLDVPAGATYLLLMIRTLLQPLTTPPTFRLWGVDDYGHIFPLYNASGDNLFTINGTAVSAASAVDPTIVYVILEVAPGDHSIDLRGAVKVIIQRVTPGSSGGADTINLYPKFDSR